METRSIRAIFSKGERCHSRLPMEIPEEAGEVAETAFVTDFGDGEIRFPQHPLCLLQPQAVQFGHDGRTAFPAIQTAEVALGNAELLRRLIQ